MKGAEKEPIILKENESFSIKYVDLQFFTRGWHWHPEIELMLVVEGEGTRFVGDSRLMPFEPGDLVLVGADLPHVWISSDRQRENDAPFRAKAYVIQFKEDCFGKDFFKKPEMDPILSLFQRAQQGIHFNGETQKLVAKKIIEACSEQGTKRLLTFIDILHNLAHSEQVTCLATPNYKEPEETGNKDRLGKAVNYILKNYHKRIPAEVLADMVGLSDSAFSTYFKKWMSVNMVSFINNLRTSKARELLTETDKEIRKIRKECGFENTSHFYVQFKKDAGCAPGKYRRDQRAKWKSIPTEFLKSSTETDEGPTASEKLVELGVEQKYICNCDKSVWGKSGLQLHCLECESDFKEQQLSNKKDDENVG